MCNETASATAVPATTVPVPAGKLRITDIVGNNYKEWDKGTRIVFDAGTNSGKTYFNIEMCELWADTRTDTNKKENKKDSLFDLEGIRAKMLCKSRFALVPYSRKEERW